jgi:excisionase family DNA binding protein
LSEGAGPHRGAANFQPTEIELLTVEDVARQLRVSRATVYRLCETGELTHTRVVKSIRIQPEAVEAFISRAQQAPPPALDVSAVEPPPGEESPPIGQ